MRDDLKERLKPEILDRLDMTINMLKQLRDEEFDLSKYVAKWNADHTCGTVCCVMGWYPKYIPDAEIRWAPKREVCLKRWHGGTYDNRVWEALQDWHHFTSDQGAAVLAAMFYMSSSADVLLTNGTIANLHYFEGTSKADVISMFTRVKLLILDDLLIVSDEQ